MMNTLAEAKRLHAFGFAVHWLKPNSKRPVQFKGWQRGPRKTWNELKASYRKGFNVGVRLGRASRFEDGTYLAVIDCDVKSEKPSHLKEMREKLKPLIKLSTTTYVESGRGNGSLHVYIRTKNPVAPFKIVSSTDLVKAFMPSVETISKRDRERLSENELKAGIRIRPAWEIGVMGEGQQVVLPPSIHPDSGNPYEWGSPCLGFEDIRPLNLKGMVPKKATEDKDAKPFKEVEVDIVTSELPDSIIEMIQHGENVSDRSAALFTVAMAMVKSRFTDDQILTVLTDRSTYLGKVAFEHRQTSSRNNAADWVRRFTLTKAKEAVSAKNHFDEEVVMEELDEESEAKQTKALKEETAIDWAAQGYYSHGPKGGLKPAYGPLMKAFEEEHPFKTIADMKTVFTFNGTHFEAVTPIHIKAFAEENFRPAPEETERSEFYSKVLANHVCNRSFFTDTTEGRVNFKNGVLDLSDPNHTLVEHSPDFGFRGVLPYDYDPDAKCPVFKKWLTGIMLGDVALCKILQEYMGYVVRGGEYKYHKALWLGGVGRNGKSTFVDLLKALIGVGNFSVISIKSLMNDKFAGADLDGKIANFSEETSPEELRDSGPFKNLTGNGDLFAQKKYGDPYTFRNRAKLIMTYNQIPDIKDLSAGMLSRPIIIPFKLRIKEHEQDRDIQKKLFAELPGIFNFALRGWHRLEKQSGFTKSERSELALKKLKEESCNVFQWADQYIDADSTVGGDGLSGDFNPRDLYMAYSKTERYPFKFIEFCRRINTHPAIRKTRIRSNGKTIYRGLRIIT